MIAIVRRTPASGSPAPGSATPTSPPVFSASAQIAQMRCSGRPRRNSARSAPASSCVTSSKLSNSVPVCAIGVAREVGAALGDQIAGELLDALPLRVITERAGPQPAMLEQRRERRTEALEPLGIDGRSSIHEPRPYVHVLDERVVHA